MLKISLEEMELMLKKMAWEAFKNTGNIKTFLELKQVENAENQIKNDLKNKDIETEKSEKEKQLKHGYSKSKWNSNSRK